MAWGMGHSWVTNTRTAHHTVSDRPATHTPTHTHVTRLFSPAFSLSFFIRLPLLLWFISLKSWAHRRPSAWQHSANIPSNGNEEWRKRINYVSECERVMYRKSRPCIQSRRCLEKDGEEGEEGEEQEKMKKINVIRRGRHIIRLMAAESKLANAFFAFILPFMHCTTWLNWFLSRTSRFLSFFFLLRFEYIEFRAW